MNNTAEKDNKDKKDKKDTGRISGRVFDLLPNPLRDVARQLDEDHERDVFLTGALPTVAGALPNVQFKYGGHWQSLNLYTGVVAPAGAGKGKMRYGRKIGRPLNEYLHEKSMKARQEWKDRKDSEEQEAGPEPVYKRLFISADTSAAELKSLLSDSPHGVIFDTEFKTLSTVLEQEWGQFRDVLLKSFQNEPVEVDRKQEEPTLVEHPAPSVAVSGTPGTFSEVISDTEDGLFSRFALYRFDEQPEWKSQFGSVEPSALDHAVEDAAEALKGMHQQQQGRVDTLYITFTDRVQRAVNQACSFVMRDWRSGNVRPELYSSLKRAAVRALRIASITRLVRHYEQGKNLSGSERIEVGMKDGEVGLRLAFTYLIHSLRIAAEFGSESDKSELDRRQRQFLTALPVREFETSDAKEIGEEMGVHKRTARRWVKRWWKETGLIEKVEHGTWKKTPDDPDTENVPGVLSVLSILSVLFDQELGGIGEIPSTHSDGAPANRSGNATGAGQ
jgi:hypothetical protein